MPYTKPLTAGLCNFTLVHMLETNSRLQELASRHPELYHLSDNDLNIIHKKHISMLRDIDLVCRRNNLHYCLYAGSLLGAVRHGGPIPWDDDLDLCMPRRDYDSFRNLFLADFSDRYWVQEAGADASYDLSFMKVRLKGTVFREFTEPDNDKAGLFVDIFPVENIFDSRMLKTLHGIMTDSVLFVCSCVRISHKKDILLKYVGRDPLAIQICIKAAIGKVLGIIPLASWLALADRCMSFCRDEDSEKVSIPSGKGHYFGEMCLRKTMFPAAEINFNGISTYGYADPDTALYLKFGNYMEIPPLSKREYHSLLDYEINDTAE